MVSSRVNAWLIASLLVFLPKPSASAQQDLSLRVTPRYALAGDNVRITVRIARDPENRLLTIEADSADYFRCSQIQLSGDRSPAVHSLMLQSVPSGRYVVRATVTRQGGDKRSVPAELRVVGVADEPIS